MKANAGAQPPEPELQSAERASAAGPQGAELQSAELQSALAAPRSWLLWFWLGLGLSLIAGFHELVLRIARAFLSPGFGPHPHSMAWSFTAGLSLALLFESKLRAHPLQALIYSLLGGAWSLGASSLLFEYGFNSQAVLTGLTLSLPFILGFSTWLIISSARKLFGPTASSLGAWGLMLNPFYVLLIVACVGLSATGAAYIGARRSVLLLSLCLVSLSLFVEPLHRALFLVSPPSAAWARLARYGAYLSFVAASFGLLAAERWLPIARVQHFPGEIVYSYQGVNQELVVTSSQEAFLLFADNQLKRTQLDGHRYHEAVVAPAMLLADEPERVAILGGGDGLLEREALQFPSVQMVTSVSYDEELSRLARSSVWLAKTNQLALSDPRVRLEFQEPLAWLDEEPNTYDILFVDLPSPTTYEFGKFYTRYFYERVAERLNPNGLAVISATSALSTPESYSSILATIQAAGLNTLEYQVGLALKGETSFIIASPGELNPNASAGKPLARGRYLNQETFERLFKRPPDTERRPSEPNLLYEQPIVEHYLKEIGVH